MISIVSIIIDKVYCFASIFDLYKCVIQQEVDDSYVEDAVVVIPTLSYVMAHDDFWK